MSLVDLVVSSSFVLNGSSPQATSLTLRLVGILALVASSLALKYLTLGTIISDEAVRAGYADVGCCAVR